MTYQVIALRYRPRQFGEVVGQEETAETLKQAVLGGRLAHAYLFSGPRGVGKTSMARILSMALNCSDPREGEPCGECASCRAIAAGADLDVIELDGASNRGIDDVRELIASAACAPMRGRRKVYIVDEVHMLTREAFNAFLKTLEEPPSHVTFIMATTEPQRIPETVASRLQRFDFRPIGEADVIRRLEQICEREGVKPGERVLERIAQYAHGGMRDAQTLLDQLITFAGAEPSLEALERVSGRLDGGRLSALLRAIDESDVRTVWQVTRQALTGVTSPEAILEQVLLETRGSVEQAIAESGIVSEELLLRLEILSEAIARLRVSPFPEIAAEITLLRLASSEGLVSIGDLLEEVRGERPESRRRPSPRAAPKPPAAERSAPKPAPPADSARRAAAPPAPPVAARPAPPAPPIRPAPPPRPPSRPEPPPRAATETAVREADEPPRAASGPEASGSENGSAVDLARVRELWSIIVEEVQKESVRTAEFLRTATPAAARGRTLILETRGQTILRHLKGQGPMQLLRSVLDRVVGGSPEVELRMGQKETDAGAAARELPVEEEPIFRKAQEIFRNRSD